MLDWHITLHRLGWVLFVAIGGLAPAPASFFTPVPAVRAAEPPVILVGKIQRLKGNQQPGLEQRPSPQAAIGQEVVVVEGRVQPVHFGDPFLPSDRLREAVISRGRSDQDGIFKVPLKAHSQEHSGDTSVITVFLVVPGGYYLNRFEGSGSFAALDVRGDSLPPLVLVDDRGAVH